MIDEVERDEACKVERLFCALQITAKVPATPQPYHDVPTRSCFVIAGLFVAYDMMEHARVAAEEGSRKLTEMCEGDQT
jgi:hypothetical protein